VPQGVVFPPRLALPPSAGWAVGPPHPPYLPGVAPPPRVERTLAATDALAALHAAAQKDKRALVASTLKLTDAEAKKFWPQPRCPPLRLHALVVRFGIRVAKDVDFPR